MFLKPAFGIADTHRILHEYKANIQGSSEGLGWTSAFASIQRERPYAGKLHALSDSLVVLHRGGPVDLTYRIEGKSVIRHIPKGGVFFLPAGHECDVELHAALDSTHIYLRSELFINEENPTQSVVEGLAPMLGERDGVIEHLAAAIGDAVVEGQPVSSLFVDPIAKAIANRFVTISYRGSAIELVKSPHRLTNRQLSKLRDFVESNLDADIRLSAMASNCGLNTRLHRTLARCSARGQPRHLPRRQQGVKGCRLPSGVPKSARDRQLRGSVIMTPSVTRDATEAATKQAATGEPLPVPGIRPASMW